MSSLPLTIVGATNATPIVITTSTPHGRLDGDAVKITEVLGNTAANSIFQIAVIDSVSFSLINSVGSGSYTSGGVAVFRGRITGLVGLLSKDLVTRIAARGLQPLTPGEDGTPGEIRIGAQYINEHSTPPRVIFVPEGNVITPGGPPSQGGTARAVDNVFPNRSPERNRQQTQKALLTDSFRFRVHVWGQDQDQSDPTPELDMDATHELYHAVLVTLQKSAIGTFAIDKSSWTASKVTNTQIVRAGMEIVFAVTFRTPVLDDDVLVLSPSDVRAAPTTQILLPDGTPAETGCSSP